MTARSDGPLAGLVVLDLATIFAGPSACRHLADFGADVIKVERPDGGDGARHLGECDGDDSFYWRIAGRNKRPIELDLKADAGREVLLRLVARRRRAGRELPPGRPGAAGPRPRDGAAASNPGLVVLRVTGYGQTGPYADRAGFGTMAEAMSTLAHTTGQPDGPPTLPPIALADEVTGLRGAFAVLAALRHRDLTGRRTGDRHQPARVAGRHRRAGPVDPAPHRRVGRPHRLPAGVLRAPQHLRLQRRAHRAVRLGEPGGAAGVRRDRPQRPSRRPSLHHRRRPDRQRRRCWTRSSAAWTSGHTVAEAIETFAAAGAAVGPVYDAEALVNDPHVRERGVLRRGREPGRRRAAPSARCPPAHVADAGRDPPRRSEPGACTDEVLAELGYPDGDRRAGAGGAVGAPQHCRWRWLSSSRAGHARRSRRRQAQRRADRCGPSAPAARSQKQRGRADRDDDPGKCPHAE